MTAIIDPNAVRRHVAILHEVAERAIGLGSAGKFLIASYGEMPPGKKLDAIHAHSAIGDAEGMVRTILALSAVPGRNVYCPLALARFDLPDRVRGSSADHIGAFGICADFDDADAALWATRLPAPPDYVLETSAGRFQAFYFFSELHGIDETTAMARRIQTAAKCDKCTDAIHVWRIAGTLNWPNAVKIATGRSPDPQLVTTIKDLAS